MFLVFLTANFSVKVVAYLSLEPRALEYLCIVNLSCVDFDDSEMFRLELGLLLTIVL